MWEIYKSGSVRGIEVPQVLKNVKLNTKGTILCLLDKSLYLAERGGLATIS